MDREIQNKIQQQAQDLARKHGYNCYLLIATGVGKSRVAVNIHKELAGTLSGPVLLLVPTEPLRDENWKAEYAKWGEDGLYGDLERACYASAHKFRYRHFGLVIADEVDVMGAPVLQKFWRENTFDHFIGLSATIPQKLFDEGLLPKLPIAMEYTIDHAVADGVVSPYELILYSHEMTAAEVKVYSVLSADVTRAWEMGRTTKWAAFNRMRFLYNLESKVPVARAIMAQMLQEKRRTLVISESTQMIDKITNLGYHSNNREADQVLQQFLNEDSVVIGSAKKLNRGMNLGPLQGLLMVSYSSSVVAAIQRFGRVCRYEEGKRAKITALVTKNTQEEKWIEKLQKGI